MEAGNEALAAGRVTDSDGDAVVLDATEQNVREGTETATATTRDTTLQDENQATADNEDAKIDQADDAINSGVTGIVEEDDANDESYDEESGDDEEDEGNAEDDDKAKRTATPKIKEEEEEEEQEAGDDDDEEEDNDDEDEDIEDEEDDEEEEEHKEKEQGETEPVQDGQEQGQEPAIGEEVKQEEQPYIPQTHNIVIPSYASWFSFPQIHQIEKDSLPEFFTNKNPSKTPTVYVKYRNFLINSYRLNPNDYLSVTAARRSLVGDVGTILRLHRFLSRWGLINYQVDAELKPKAVEPPYTGDYNVSYDAPRGLFPFEPYKPPLEDYKIEKLKELVGVKRTLDDDRAKSDYQTQELGNKKVKTDSKTTNGTKLDIVHSINDGWAKEDLKKLLEGLIKFKGEWSKIAEYVGNHTAEQCILRFLKLPIEDKFLKNKKNENGILKYAPYLPFSQADNPVLSTLAFLTSLIDPEIVKRTTENAIKFIDENDITKTLDAELNEDKKPDTTETTDTLQEVGNIAFSAVGARSHIFKTNEEIEMNKLTNVIVNTQLNKIDLRLKKLETIEESLSLEKKLIQQQKEELFLDRLSFAKLTNSVISKLKNLKEATANTSSDSTDQKIAEIQELLSKNPRFEINSFNEFSKTLENDVKNDATTNGDNSNINTTATASAETEEEDDLKPISIETPQTYRYWSG